MPSDAILERIRAIASRTTENGCTEAEAMAAAAKLAELLAKYNVNLTNIELKEQTCQSHYEPRPRKHYLADRYCSVAIAYMCDCRVWNSNNKYTVFFGLPTDVEAAKYLLAICRNAVAHETMQFMLLADFMPEKYGDDPQETFIRGMCRRISIRLREMKDMENGKTKTCTGRDLIVVKNAIVVDQFDKLGFRLAKSRRTAISGSKYAFNQGIAAGDRVSFNRGLSSGNPTKWIGSK